MTTSVESRPTMKIRFLRKVVQMLSRLSVPWARRLGNCVGELAWLFKTRGSVTAQTNLRFCFPDKPEQEISALARESMRQWGQTLFEVPVVWRAGEQGLAYIRSVDGENFLDEAIAAGRGTIVVAPHLGNWELLGNWLTTKGPSNFLYQPPREPGLEEIIIEGRTALGAKLVPTDLRGVSTLIKVLKKGEIAGILPDMEPDTGKGVFAPFFGRQAMTMTLVNRLQQKSGASIVFAFARRVDKGFQIVVREPSPEIHSEDEQTAMAALNRGVEQLVVMAPAQYQWEYKRFKRRPPGEARIYT